MNWKILCFLIGLFTFLGIYKTTGQKKQKVQSFSMTCLRESMWGTNFPIHNYAKSNLVKSRAGTTTSINNEVKIFVTWTPTYENGDCIYFHSNYKPKGFQYTCKFASNEHYDLEGVTSDMIKTDPFTFSKAFKKDITFIIDYRVFHHVKYNDINLGSAENIVIMGRNGVMQKDGYKILKTQRELKKLGYLKGYADGISGKETETALLKYKKEIRVEPGAVIYVHDNQGKKAVEFKYAGDFLEKFASEAEGCSQPVSICVYNNLVATFVVECAGQSIEFSTTGEITLTASNEGRTYSVTLNKKEETPQNDCNGVNTGTSFSDPVQFLKCYQSTYNQHKADCENAIKLCLGKGINLSFETNCFGNTISASTNGQISVSAKQGGGKTFEF